VLARQQIHAKFVREREEIPPSMTVTFGELDNELLDASHRHGNDRILLFLLEFCRLVERMLERQLEIKCNRWRFRRLRGSGRIRFCVGVRRSATGCRPERPPQGGKLLLS
jgi:hypothetical protein